jgi:RHS repeat-associated protein
MESTSCPKMGILETENRSLKVLLEVFVVEKVCVRDNQFLYNGKERQDELGLGWYDYGARMYNPAIGRFNSVDRFAEKYQSTTPYHYTLNNPILFIDVNGDSITVRRQTEVIDGKKIKVFTVNVTAKVINNSSQNFSDQNMNTLAKEIEGGIKTVFTFRRRRVKVNVITDIQVASSEDQINPGDHVFRLVDDGKVPETEDSKVKYNPKGTTWAEATGDVVYIATDDLARINPDGTFVYSKVAQSGEWASRGRAANGAETLFRTGVHELGHTANLRHPTDLDGPFSFISRIFMRNNFMTPDKREKNVGTRATTGQVRRIWRRHKNYNGELINTGQQKV